MSVARSGSGTFDVRLQNLADNLPGGMVFQVAATGDVRRFVYVSRGVEMLFGVTPSEALADANRLYGRIEPAHMAGLGEAEQKSLATGEPFFAEVPLLPLDGKVRWVQISSARRLAPDGSSIWDGVVLDITRRKEAELLHRELESRLELATEAAAIGIWHWDVLSGEMVYSPRAKAIYGFPLSEKITYEKLRELNLPEDDELIAPKLARALDPALRQNETYTYRIRRFDTGELRWLMAHGKATFEMVDGVARATSYVGTLQDITEQKRAEVQLRESEARLRLAIGAGAMAVWEIDAKTGTITPSPELNVLYGFPLDATPTLADFRTRYAPGEGDRLEAEAAEVMGRGEANLNFEAKQIWPDGTVRWISIRAQVISDTSGAPQRVIGVVMDITQRRSAEEQLAIVARELQHRVKNSLTVIQTLASQTFRPGRSYDEAMAAFTGRLQALSIATDVLTRTDWSTGTLKEVIDRVLGPYRDDANDRFDIVGKDTALPSKVVMGVGMALHELCTNALKYGALSGSSGRVMLRWSEINGWLAVDWLETGGPPVNPVATAGFGTRLLRRGIFEGAAGGVDLQFLPGGVACHIRARL